MPFSTKKIVYSHIFSCIILLSSLTETKATISQCTVKSNFLLTDNDAKLRISYDAMMDTYHEACTPGNFCPTVMDEIFTTTHLNFDKLMDTNEYEDAKMACESIGTDDAPTTLCRANSELLLYNDQDDSNGEAVDDFYVQNEPVCFPFECGQKQVGLFHNNPLGCDPDSMNCLVFSLDIANCGKRPEGAGIGNCVKHAKDLQRNEEFSDKMNLLHSAAGMQCIESKLDKGDNEVCTVESKPVNVTIGKNFRQFEDNPAYLDFIDTCKEMKGATCHMSAMIKLKGRTGFINMDLVGDYNDYPICLHNTCSREEMEIVTTNKIGDSIVKEINKIVESHARRKLLPDLNLEWNVDDFVVRRLQDTAGDYECPLNGLEVCEFLVSDFYCEGVQTVVGKSSSSTSSLSVGTIFATIALGLGILI